MTVMLSCLLMLIALSVRAFKVGCNGTIPSSEAAFLVLCTVSCMIPVLNIVLPVYYLCKTVKQ